MQRHWKVMLRGLVAALLLGALVLVVPLLLAREVGWPLPTTMPSWTGLSHAISTGAIQDATIIKALAVLVWLTWANFAGGVIIEASAIARGTAARRVAGLRTAQHLAANLLTSVSLAAALLVRPMSAPAPADLRIAAATAPTDQSPLSMDLARSVRPSWQAPAPHRPSPPPSNRPTSSPSPSSDTQLYEVQRGDTLWDLADRVLGDGMRWREIRDLNVGREQPDGRVLQATTEELRAGWTVRLPSPNAAMATASIAVDGATDVVEEGDTLWDLAEEHLDDPTDWPELYELNRDRVQSDGDALTDPDLIRPGWVLELPTTGSDPATGRGHEPSLPAASTAPADDRGGAVSQASPPKPSQEVRPPSEHPSPISASSGLVADTDIGDRDTDDDAAFVPLAVGGTVAAGIVLTLDRLRRARLRRRQPGHRIPMPEGNEAVAEQRLRTGADPDADRFVDLALRELSDHLAEHCPTVTVRRASWSSSDLLVHLAPPSDSPPSAWESGDGDAVWCRRRPDDLGMLESYAGTPSLFPALVTIGRTADARVALLNLAAVDCIHLVGDDSATNDLLAAWALELATTSRADALDVVTVGIDGVPTGLERLVELGDPSEFRGLLTKPSSLDRSGVPTIVVLAADLSTGLDELIPSEAASRSDLVAAVAGPERVNGDPSLHLGRGGRARLEPDGVEVDEVSAIGVAPPVTAKLIQQALQDPDQLVQLPDDPEADGGAEPREEMDGPAGDPREVVDGLDDETAVEVRVLGPVEVVGEVQPFRTNKTIELIVYLALHRRGADADTLLEALWPEQEPRPARLYTEASRARKALGTAPDGSPHLPGAELGRYRLETSVALDYERFVSSVRAARRDPMGAATHLRRALDHVRGVPMSATATEYAWATTENYRLAQEIVDAAHYLAELSIAAERYDDAVWAAERGLLAYPMAEILIRDLMRAAAATGNSVRLHAVMTRLRRLVAEDADSNDGDDWLHPETIALFETLTGGDAGTTPATTRDGRQTETAPHG